MRFRWPRRAEGGAVVSPGNSAEGVPMVISGSGVMCPVTGCGWAYLGGTRLVQQRALAEHTEAEHADH